MYIVLMDELFYFNFKIERKINQKNLFEVKKKIILYNYVVFFKYVRLKKIRVGLYCCMNVLFL